MAGARKINHPACLLNSGLYCGSCTGRSAISHGDRRRVGVMTYEGDFNGNVLSDMQPAGFLVGRYNFDPYKDLKLSVGFGKIKGSSAKVDTFYPDYAENPYSFNHTLVDMNLVFEYNFWPYGTGRDYRGAQRLVPYILGGLGATYVKGNEKMYLQPTCL